MQTKTFTLVALAVLGVALLETASRFLEPEPVALDRLADHVGSRVVASGEVDWVRNVTGGSLLEIGGPDGSALVLTRGAAAATPGDAVRVTGIAGLYRGQPEIRANGKDVVVLAHAA